MRSGEASLDSASGEMGLGFKRNKRLMGLDARMVMRPVNHIRLLPGPSRLFRIASVFLRFRLEFGASPVTGLISLVSVLQLDQPGTAGLSLVCRSFFIASSRVSRDRSTRINPLMTLTSAHHYHHHHRTGSKEPETLDPEPIQRSRGEPQLSLSLCVGQRRPDDHSIAPPFINPLILVETRDTTTH